MGARETSALAALYDAPKDPEAVDDFDASRVVPS